MPAQRSDGALRINRYRIAHATPVAAALETIWQAVTQVDIAASQHAYLGILRRAGVSGLFVIGTNADQPSIECRDAVGISWSRPGSR